MRSRFKAICLLLSTYATSTGWETCTHEGRDSLIQLRHTAYAYYVTRLRFALNNLNQGGLVQRQCFINCWLEISLILDAKTGSTE